MFLDNNRSFELKQNFLVSTSQHLLVKTALKAGAFSCECGCSQIQEAIQDAVVPSVATPSVATPATTTTNTI